MRTCEYFSLFSAGAACPSLGAACACACVRACVRARPRVCTCRENSREFGVLRAIGLTANQVARVYLYEAATVVLTSFFMGTCIGLGIAISLTLQFNLFTEMPLNFAFPYFLFFSVFGLILGACYEHVLWCVNVCVCGKGGGG